MKTRYEVYVLGTTVDADGPETQQWGHFTEYTEEGSFEAARDGAQRYAAHRKMQPYDSILVFVKRYDRSDNVAEVHEYYFMGVQTDATITDGQGNVWVLR